MIKHVLVAGLLSVTVSSADADVNKRLVVKQQGGDITVIIDDIKKYVTITDWNVVNKPGVQCNQVLFSPERVKQIWRTDCNSIAIPFDYFRKNQVHEFHIGASNVRPNGAWGISSAVFFIAY